MKDFFKTLVLISVLISPALALAQVGDTAPDTSVGQCLSLSNNMGYLSRDSATGGEVSLFQDFLSPQFLNYEPTGFFGKLTLSSTKVFQAQKYNDINVNEIDVLLVPNANTRNILADNGFILGQTGYVGALTRAKIKYVSCHSVTTAATPTTQTTQTQTITNPFAQTQITQPTTNVYSSYPGSVNIQTNVGGNPLAINLIYQNSNGCENHSINWGDGSNSSRRPQINEFCTQAITQIIIPHTYSQEGTYIITAQIGSFSNQTKTVTVGQTSVSTAGIVIANSALVPSQNIAVNVPNQVLGGFSLSNSSNQYVSIGSISANLLFPPGQTAADITNIIIQNSSGTVVAGPVNIGASGRITFSDLVIVPPGISNYFIKGKLGTAFANGNLVQLAIIKSSWIAINQTTGASVSLSPSIINLSIMTARAGALNISLGAAPPPSTIVAGSQNVTFANYQFDAAQSSEDIRVTWMDLKLTSSASQNNLTNCQLWDGATSLNSSANIVNPSGNAGVVPVYRFTFDNFNASLLVITKGTIKTISLKCNISASAPNGSTYSWGIEPNASISAVGLTSGNSIAPTAASSNGPIMTIGSVASTPAPTITIISPNGGETLQTGQTYRIRWTSTGVVDKVALLLDSSGIGNWVAYQVPNIGYYDWIVSKGDATNNSQFKISATGYPAGPTGNPIDNSDSFFTINVSTTPTPTLVVSNVAQPANGLAPQGVLNIPFTKLNLTNNGTSQIVVSSITVQKTGAGSDSILTSIGLKDENGVQLGTPVGLNSNHQANIGGTFTINPGQTKTLTVVGNTSPNLSSYAGSNISLSIVAVNIQGYISGVLPIIGATHTANATLVCSSSFGYECTTTTPAPVTFNYFTVSPNPHPVYSTYQQVALSWSANNATSCFLTGQQYGASGTIYTTASNVEKIYTLSCTGSGGTSAATTTVERITQTAPSIGSFTASPTSISSGQSTTLSWSSIANVSYCTTSWGGGSLGNGSGQQTISPTQTTTYTINCTGSGGSANKSVTVSVNAPAPALTLSAVPSTINPGGISNISLTGVTNATSCSTSGAGWTNSAISSGDLRTVTPSNTTTYTVTCTGSSGSISKSVTVTVNTSAPTATLSASPTSITQGAPVTLTWSSTGATSCYASGNWQGTKASSGNEIVYPTQSAYSYFMSCTGSGGTSNTQSLDVTVAPPPASTVLRVTILLNGSSSAEGITVSPAQQFTIQATGTHDPTECQIITAVGYEWGEWTSYQCSQYAQPVTVTPATFGFVPGFNRIAIFMRNAAGQTDTVTRTVTVSSATSYDSSQNQTASIFLAIQNFLQDIDPNVSYSWSRDLQVGSSYQGDVRALQTAFTKEGVYAGEITGGFYSQTFAAVKEFQKKYGIDQTGFVGPITRAKLNELYGR